MSNELQVITSYTTDFLNPDQVKEFISKIPELSIYHRDIYNRKPLSSKSFQLLIHTIYDGALRAGEGRTILVQDLENLRYGRLNLPHTKTGWDWCKCASHQKKKLISCDLNCKKCKGTGKILRPQWTTISESLAKKLYKFINQNKLGKKDYVFASPSFPKQPISRDWLYKNIREVGTLCNIEIFGQRKSRLMKNLYSHIFRRSKAIQMDHDGASIGMIATKLRHTDIRVTTTYIKTGIGDLEKWEKEFGVSF